MHLTYQKLLIKINDDFLISFMMRFSSNDAIRVLFSPSIGSLNDYLACKITRAIKNRPTELPVVK